MPLAVVLVGVLFVCDEPSSLPFFLFFAAVPMGLDACLLWLVYTGSSYHHYLYYYYYSLSPSLLRRACEDIAGNANHVFHRRKTLCFSHSHK